MGGRDNVTWVMCTHTAHCAPWSLLLTPTKTKSWQRSPTNRRKINHVPCFRRRSERRVGWISGGSGRAPVSTFHNRKLKVIYLIICSWVAQWVLVPFIVIPGLSGQFHSIFRLGKDRCHNIGLVHTNKVALRRSSITSTLLALHYSILWI